MGSQKCTQAGRAAFGHYAALAVMLEYPIAGDEMRVAQVHEESRLLRVVVLLLLYFDRHFEATLPLSTIHYPVGAAGSVLGAGSHHDAGQVAAAILFGRKRRSNGEERFGSAANRKRR